MMTGQPECHLGYECIGQGPRNIIMLHDWLSDASYWNMVSPLLDISGTQWMFTDLRGYGLSMELAGEFSLAEASADIIRLADKLSLERFSVVGHSMSCLVALHLAQEWVERVESVAVFTPPPLAGFDESMFVHLQSLARADDAGRTMMMLEMWGDALTENWAAYKIANWRKTADPLAAETYVSMFTASGLPDPKKKITVPVMLVTGDQDMDVMQEVAALPQFAPIAGDLIKYAMPCGHYPMQEMPPMTAALLNRFFTKS